MMMSIEEEEDPDLNDAIMASLLQPQHQGAQSAKDL